jgi:uncharacterized protein with FMN-binding domain/NAD-dependent dihydropyrimidine dehydrogenase PreA subunit
MLIFHGQGTIVSALPSIVILTVATLVTAFAGRFFCGWMCSFGALSDFLYRAPRIGKKIFHKPPALWDNVLKYVKYGILAAVVVLVWGFQIVAIPPGTNPWDLFGMLVSFGNWPPLSQLLSVWLPAVIILAAIMVASVFYERFFCRYLCPLGAYFGIISKMRSVFIGKPRENCGQCTLCTAKCSMGIDLRTMEGVHSGECIDCMECIRWCPKDNANLEVSGRSLNVVVAGTLSCAVIAGGYYLGNFTGTRFTNTVNSLNPTYSVNSQSDTAVGIGATVSDGTYKGSGMGFRGETDVTVTVQNGKITNITVDSYEDDPQYFQRAASAIIQEIISSQSVDVDAVTGATYSSNGIISAVANALGLQYTPSSTQSIGSHGH